MSSESGSRTPPTSPIGVPRSTRNRSGGRWITIVLCSVSLGSVANNADLAPGRTS